MFRAALCHYCHTIKDTINEAIKVEMMYAGTAEPRDEKMFRTLKLAFLPLASFLPDDEVVSEFEVDEALDSDDVCHNYYKYLDGSEKASNHILEQTSVLVEELDKFCREMVYSFFFLSCPGQPLIHPGRMLRRTPVSLPYFILQNKDTLL